MAPRVDGDASSPPNALPPAPPPPSASSRPVEKMFTRGTARGRGMSEGHSPTSNPGCVPTRYHSLKSAVANSSASYVESRHSPCAVRHAEVGSRCVLLAIGLSSKGFVQLVRKGSERLAGKARARVVPVSHSGQTSLVQMPGYTCTIWSKKTVALPVKTACESYASSFQSATGSRAQCTRSREHTWAHTGPPPGGMAKWSWKKTWYMPCTSS